MPSAAEALRLRQEAARAGRLDKAIGHSRQSQQYAAVPQIGIALGQLLCAAARPYEGTRLLFEAASALLVRSEADPEALVAVAQLLQPLGDVLRGLALAEAIVAPGVRTARALYLLATAAAQLNRYEQALAACEQAMRLAAGNAALEVLHASITLDADGANDALAGLEAVLDGAPARATRSARTRNWPGRWIASAAPARSSRTLPAPQLWLAACPSTRTSIAGGLPAYSRRTAPRSIRRCCAAGAPRTPPTIGRVTTMRWSFSPARSATKHSSQASSRR